VKTTNLLYLVTEDWYFCSHRLPVARAARDQGWQVQVATHVHPDQPHGRIIESEGFQLLPLSRLRRRHASLLAGLWQDAAAVLELVVLYRRLRPRIVHHVALKPVLFGTLAARLTGVPRVVNALAGLGHVFTAHDRHARLLRAIIQPMLRWLLRHPSVHVIVQNHDDAAAIRAITGIAPEQWPDALVVIPGSGVDVAHFVPVSPPPHPLPSPHVVVTMAARMLKDKGVPELVEAARQLQQRGCPVQIQLVGAPDPDNPSSIALEQLEEWQRSGVIHWRGEQRDMRAIWQGSDVAVLPSHREGLPKALLEAAACGLPLIATDVPGCRDVVEHGQNGLLVPLHDATALATAIDTLVHDTGLRQRMGLCSRERTLRLHAEAWIVAATLRVYHSRSSCFPVDSPPVITAERQQT
jgi:glycosyltransferase involved in cell wall biosynthesis